MVEILSDYESKKDKCISVLGTLEEKGFIPCKVGETVIDEKSVTAYANDLAENRFILSICGQIKAGKSSLLNYLLFSGESRLPVNDAPCTAVLSRIKYGEQNKACVHFYTLDEWNKLKQLTVEENDDNSIKEIDYYDTYLREFVERSAEKGVYDREVIHPKRFKHELDDLKDLEKYIDKDGVYTPFVHYVELFLANDFLKSIEIVDTPGINDPNVFRSKRTLDWVKSSTAVIMLLYAGRPLDKPDYDFIDQYLQFVNSRRIIFALSKIDLVENYSRAKDWIETNLKNSKELSDRDLLSGDREVYPICTIAASIAHKNKSGLDLTEDEQFFAGAINEDLIKRNGYLPEFNNAIETHIMKDKGNAIIEDAIQFIDATCSTKINEIKTEIEKSRERIAAFDLDIEEIDKKLQQVNLAKEKIREIEDGFRKKRNQFTTDLGNKMTYKIDTLIDQEKSRFEDWVIQNTTERVLRLSGYQLKKSINKTICLGINDFIDEEISEELDDLKRELIVHLKEAVKSIDSRRFQTYFAPVINIKSIQSLIEDHLDQITPDFLEEFRKRRFGFLWTLHEETKANVIREIGTILDDLAATLAGHIEAVFDKEIRENLDPLTDNVLKILNEQDDQYNDVKEKKDLKEEEKSSARSEQDRLQTVLQELENNYAAIQKELADAQI